MYYSGHGVFSKSKLAPCAVGVDGKFVNLQRLFLRQAASPSGSSAVILLSDSCLEEADTSGGQNLKGNSNNQCSPVSKEAGSEVCLESPWCSKPTGNLLVGAHATQPGQVAVEADRMLYGVWTSCLLEALLLEDCRGCDILRVLAQTGRLMRDRGCCEPPYSLCSPGALSTVSLGRCVTFRFPACSLGPSLVRRPHVSSPVMFSLCRPPDAQLTSEDPSVGCSLQQFMPGLARNIGLGAYLPS